MNNLSIGTTQNTYSYTDTAHIDAPTSYGSTGNMNSYRYDAAGSQTLGTVKGTSQTRTYDPENRLSSVMTGTTTLSFVYDANGKRVTQNVTVGLGLPKRTLYVGNLYEEELSSASHPYTVYYLLGAKMVGIRRGNQAASNGQYRMVTDQLGSTSLMVNTSSPPSVVFRQYYKPYGEVAFQNGSSLTSVGYTGQRLDGDSGLMYYGARYYDPVLSYFISPDPTTPDPKKPVDYEKYLYARGNPLRFVDISGFGPEDYYVFLNGCVTSPKGCANNDPLTEFGDYVTLLRQLFKEGHWGNNFVDINNGRPISFEVWAQDHIITHRVSRNLVDGGFHMHAEATQLENILSQIPGSSNIHLFGTSEGGAVIFQYFADMYAKLGTGENIDHRLASVTTIDSPLNDVEGLPDQGYGISEYLEENTRIKTRYGTESANERTALNVDVRSDSVDHRPIRGIDYDGNPDYGQNTGLILHEYTGQNPAVHTKEFLMRVWK